MHDHNVCDCSVNNAQFKHFASRIRRAKTFDAVLFETESFLQEVSDLCAPSQQRSLMAAVNKLSDLRLAQLASWHLSLDAHMPSAELF